MEPSSKIIYGRKSVVPDGAIHMNEKEALKMQYATVDKWKPESDVWSFKYGPFVLSCVGGLVGYYGNSKFREFLKLRSYARFSTYMPITVLPAIMVFGSHVYFTTNDILLYKTRCTVCTEIRASAWQLVFGVAYPLILTPLMTFHFSSIYGTYIIPNLFTNYKDAFFLYKTILRRMSPVIYFLIAFNVCAATYVTHMENKSALKIGLEMLH